MVAESSSDDRLLPSAWADSYRSLVDAAREELAADDLEVLAIAAYLIGDDDVSADAWEAAYHRHQEVDAKTDAVRSCFWLALTLMLNGRMAHAGGWLTRAEGALAGAEESDAVGYLLIPQMLQTLESGDPAGAVDLASRARTLGASLPDPDLVALATLGHGQALIAAGDVAGGLRRLDDAMLSVEAGDVGPVASGIVYCAVILECMEVFDLARASEWTTALDAWCRAQPEMAPYRGQCLVHQSQLRQAAGDWADALAAVIQARDRLSDPPHPALGMAHYQEAELLRAMGLLDGAGEAYERASRAGHEPLPGLALLAFERGDTQAASATIRRGLHEARTPVRRVVLLSAAVRILCGSGHHDEAVAAAAELAGIAAGMSSDVISAMADEATGAVKLDGGDPSDALTYLRAAAAGWRRLSMPHDLARTRVLIGRACAALGDTATALLELSDARTTFAGLGAERDLAGLEPLARELGLDVGDARETAASTLSARELEVLAHVAKGRTGPEIARELTISPHTVRRHLENVFAKLGVNSRAAAIAKAYEQRLL